MISWNRFYDPETGRYITADPIGLAGGMNLYAYANQNPVNFVDKQGLAVIAYCGYFSGGATIGGGILRCDLFETECGSDGKKYKAKYMGVFVGATVGQIAGQVWFSATFEYTSNVNDLAGYGKIKTYGAAFGVGAAFGTITLGGHTSSGPGGEQVGLDMSADAFAGFGWVYAREPYACCENE